MATLSLTTAANALTQGTFFQGSVAAFALTATAFVAGTYIDNKLFGVSVNQEGQRLSEIKITTSSEGQIIKRLYGRSRVGGNMIWATNFTETSTTEKVSGGKGGLGAPTPTQTSYEYFCSFAVAFCEGGEKASLGRMWADNELLDTSNITFRVYSGTEDQQKDPKIVAVEGDENTSSFRGIFYIVFENLNLTAFGNRIPQITAEIIVPVVDDSDLVMENVINSINLIPASGEVAYGTTPSINDDGRGNTVAENIHLNANRTDMQLSIDQLKESLPNCGNLNLVVSWFGNDLRMSDCSIEPRVEFNGLPGSAEYKVLQPIQWNVSGQSRLQVNDISKDPNGHANYGGTPSDHTIVEAIKHICDDQSINLYFYPFLLMDIVPGNTLPNTEGGIGQPEFPWRGRITLSSSSLDKTTSAQGEVDSFFGSVSVSDFSVSGTTVTYTGNPTDYGYRRMILHYAHLCAATANTLTTKSRMKGFYVGSEMRGVTRVRKNGTGVYPGVLAMNTLLNDVKTIFSSAGLPNVELSYAADWSEYNSHRPSDGTGDVFFNMDTIWSNANCDFIAIDFYAPVSDWRVGDSHLDYGEGNDLYGNARAISIYNGDYLRGQIEGGEDYDYYYASDLDRTNQIRTPITDTAEGKDWVFRQKDIRNWWSNEHFNRPSGVESGSSSSWAVASKRIVLSEFGVSAVDKGSNQPNVFYDPKSSESSFPRFSSGQRDDQIQRSFYESMIGYWKDNSPTINSIKMLDTEDMFAWTWDARPYPAFPFRSDIWSDAENWERGHWLNGRAGIVPLGELVKIICSWVGLGPSDIDVTGLIGSQTNVRGFLIETITSPRDALGILFGGYFFDAFESEGLIKFSLRSNAMVTNISKEDFISNSSSLSGYVLARSEEIELPGSSIVSFYDEKKDYQVGTVGSKRQTTNSSITAELRFPLILTDSLAKTISEVVIQESWAARESIRLSLPMSKIALDPGDAISLDIESREMIFRIESIDKGSSLEFDALGFDVSVYDTFITGDSATLTGVVKVYGKSVLVFMDLPLVTGEEDSPWAPRVAAYQDPFPSSVNIFEDTGSDLLLNTQVFSITQVGRLVEPLIRGPHTIIDEGSTILVDMNDENYQVLGDTENNVRNGSNAIAVQTSSGDWEIIKFINSSLVSGRRYRLSRLIRGQLGTYPIMENSVPIDNIVIFLTQEATQSLNIAESRKFEMIDYRYGPDLYDTSSGFYQNGTYTGKATGQIPYPVTDIQFSVDGSNVTISWKRQTRFGGGEFDEATVPLNEDSELYQIDLLDSSDVLLSTVEISSPTYVYTGAPILFKARIYQMSSSVGRGRPQTAQFGG